MGARTWKSLALATVVALVLGAETMVEAQEIVLGGRVRVTAPDRGLVRAVGTVERMEQGTVTVRFHRPWIDGTGQPGEVVLDIERAGITRLEVANGKRSASKATLVGLVTLGAVGAAIGYARGDDHPSTPTRRAGCDPAAVFCLDDAPDMPNIRLTAGNKAVIGGVVGAVAGALVGGLIGSIPRDRWVEVRSKSAELLVGAAPGGGTTVGVSLRR